jgi:hypothetical protein
MHILAGFVIAEFLMVLNYTMVIPFCEMDALTDQAPGQTEAVLLADGPCCASPFPNTGFLLQQQA